MSCCAAGTGDVEQGGDPANPAPSSRHMSGTAHGGSQPSLGQLMASRRIVNPSGGLPSSARSVGSQVNPFACGFPPPSAVPAQTTHTRRATHLLSDLPSPEVLMAHADMRWLPICMVAVGGRSSSKSCTRRLRIGC